ncbi:MAG: PASTA domain-containing protein [Bacteroidia bacterium]
MNLKSFFKIFFANIFSIVLSVMIIFTVVSFVLNYVTRHGESLTVPDLRGLKVNDVQRILSEKNLRFTIIDSVYFADKPLLSVVEQNPPAQAKVKVGRMIYLSINANAAPQVSLPQLVDVSVRQATQMLLSSGLKTGRIIYKPDIAQNVVLDMLYRGQRITAGANIPKGSSIDLVLGDGLMDADVPVPELTGLTLEEAGNLLSSSSLNMGSVFYQGTVKDTAKAKVFKQNPAFSDGKMIKGGNHIDLFLKQE